MIKFLKKVHTLIKPKATKTIRSEAKILPIADKRKFNLSKIMTREYKPPKTEAITARYCLISDFAKKDVEMRSK